MFFILLTLGAHAHESYGSLSVTRQSTDFLRGLYNKMNILNDFKLSSKGFQLRNFSKKLSFNSYSFSRSFSALGRPFLRTVNGVHCTRGSVFYPVHWACAVSLYRVYYLLNRAP